MNAEPVLPLKAMDWSRTWFGASSTWPTTLRSVFEVALASRNPTVIFWGPELRLLYNDAYVPILGRHNHPRALGEQAKRIWAYDGDLRMPPIERALAGQVTHLEHVRFDVASEEPERGPYFDLSCSPVTDDGGVVRGVFCSMTTAAETHFYCNLSYEFRTPLTLILGPLEDALRDTLDPLSSKQRTRTQTVHRNAVRLLKLVDALLDFSQVESGSVEPRHVPTDVASLTAAIASAFRSLIENSGLRFIVDCPPLREPIAVDRRMWEKIVLNLISNAFKFTPSGQIDVRVEEDATSVRLIVKDTGAGIATRRIPRLFERCHGGEGARGRTYHPAELGLALVRELVRLHRGSIDVQSVVDVGSTFTVSLPRLVGDAPLGSRQLALPFHSLIAEAPVDIADAVSFATDERPRIVVSRSEVVTAAGKREFHILVADDDDDLCSYLERLLEPIATVQSVGDGLQALEAIKRRVPDLLLCDVMMPNLDGHELLAAIRSERTTQNMLVMMLSARASEEERIEGVSAGADDYIVKPFSGRELLARVRTQLLLAAQRRALATSEDEFRVAFAASTVGMCQTEPTTGRVLRVNARFCAMLGYAEEELVGACFFDLTHPDDRAASTDQLLRMARGEIAELRLEVRYQRKDGAGSVWAEVTANLVRDAAGRPVRSLTIVHDITERKAAEQERRRWLEERVQWQAREEWQAKLRASEDHMIAELRANDQRKSEFIAVLSHELRNPLAAIRSSLYLLEHGGPASEPTLQAQSIIDRQVALLTRMVDDLLDVTRISQNKIQLRLEPVDLNAMVQRTLQDNGNHFRDKGVPISLQLMPGPLFVMADEARMQQVITNLIWNAVKFTPASGLVTVSSRSDGDHAVLTVSDTGVGIEPEVLAKIFQPFMQADRTLDRSNGGLGLGLALVKGLVDLHHGTIRAASEGAGRGAAFRLTFPLTEAPVAKPPLLTPAVSTKLRLLVIDDDPDVSAPLGAALALQGHEVALAEDGPSGLAKAHTFLPDVILCDVGLPGMSGYDVARALRADQSFHGVFLVALTGYAQPKDVGQAQSSGFDLHLTKPMSPADIARAIAEGSARANLRSAASNAPATILFVDDEPSLRLVVGDVLRDQGYQVLVAATTSKAVALTEAHVGRIDLLVSDLRLPEIGGVRLAELLRQMHPGLPVIFISGGVDMPSGVPNLLKPFEVSALLDLVRETLRAARDVANESVARH